MWKTVAQTAVKREQTAVKKDSSENEKMFFEV